MQIKIAKYSSIVMWLWIQVCSNVLHIERWEKMHTFQTIRMQRYISRNAHTTYFLIRWFDTNQIFHHFLRLFSLSAFSIINEFVLWFRALISFALWAILASIFSIWAFNFFISSIIGFESPIWSCWNISHISLIKDPPIGTIIVKIKQCTGNKCGQYAWCSPSG